MENEAEKQVLIHRTRTNQKKWNEFKAIAKILFPNEEKPHELLLNRTIENVLNIYRKRL